MTSVRSEKRVSEGESKSDELAVEIIVFECGHGDTILIHLPGDKWALVDCHLHKGSVRKRFFRLIEERNISRLDILCLTHPHKDHFWGMLEVIEYFTSDNRSIGNYFDIGVDPKQIIDILREKKRSKLEVSEYYKLHRHLHELFKNKSVRYRSIDENTEAIVIAGAQHRVEFLPVAPDPVSMRQLMRSTLEKEKVAGSLNALSLVLLLRVTTEKEEFNFLLAGDSEGDALEGVNQRLKERLGVHDGILNLDVIKVPHHGSSTSFSDSITQGRRPESESVAAISVGTRWAGVPDRQVLRGYMDHGWTVLMTTRRVADGPTNLALTLSGRATGAAYDVQRQDIIVSWKPGAGVSWAPESAAVSRDDLSLYQTSLDSG